ncbi:MAG: cytochrome c biogenesis protein CcdA [candidate division NC10 bacterium]|nr:cytochrome c biogenesis protein CcdA [candidate division NC10 bacterium]
MDLNPGLLSFAFSVGWFAALNPCGFAMLPAYVAYLLGREGKEGHAPRSVLAGILGGVAMTFGVVLVLAGVGGMISAVGTAIARFFPWFNILVGLVLAALGIGMLTRKNFIPDLVFLKVPLPTPGSRLGGSLAPFFLFGAGFGIASLGCTLPLFLIVLTQALAAGGPLQGLGVFVAYGLGMASILLGLSVVVAIGKEALVRYLDPISRQLRWVSAVGLVVAGSYLIYYQVVVGRLVALMP